MVIPINLIQWLLISSAFSISSSRLVSSFSSILQQNEFLVKVLATIFILSLNLALAFSFK
uniref:Uncharacterized protein n=1 Tax=Romanomermis culicivorax TaxID=13658 RepID=A0A915JAX5_ROMCU